jgi:hypothetical protein
MSAATDEARARVALFEHGDFRPCDVDSAVAAMLAYAAEAVAAERERAAGIAEMLRQDVVALFELEGTANCDECEAPLFDHDETCTDEAETVALCAGHRFEGAPIYDYRLAAIRAPIKETEG